MPNKDDELERGHRQRATAETGNETGDTDTERAAEAACVAQQSRAEETKQKASESEHNNVNERVG